MERRALELTQSEAELLRALPLELDEFSALPNNEKHGSIARLFSRHLHERGLAAVSIPSPGYFVVQITDSGMQALAIRDALDE